MRWFFGAVALGSLVAAGCVGPFAADGGGADAPSMFVDEPTAPIARLQPGLENVLRVGDRVLSGSMPEGDAGFASLAAIGVQTIVSVDGARPDVAMAEARGMRYVHIPTQYAGIGTAQRLALAKALREMPRPIYVHCHHGTHRGPAAVASAMVACGEMTPDAGGALLAEAGTSPKYPGLFAAVSRGRVLSEAEIAALDSIALVSVAEVRGMAEAMSDVNLRFEHLRVLGANGWDAPADHPDLVAAAEAGILADRFRALLDDEEVARNRVLAGLMREAADDAARLEAAVVSGREDEAFSAMAVVASRCDACHAVNRDGLANGG